MPHHVAHFGRDLRDAARLFSRTPGLAVVAVVSLTLSLGLSLTVFRVANAYVLRAMPYPSADRLHSLSLSVPGEPFVRGADALPWSSLDDVVEHQIAWDLDMFYLIGGDYPEPAPGAWITPSFTAGLGVQVVLGRTLGPADFSAAGPTPILISHRLWTTRFGGDTGVLGQPVRAYVSDRPDEAETFEVVGVLAPDFWHVNAYTDVMAPLRAPFTPYMLTLKPAVPSAIVQARVRTVVTTGLPQFADTLRVDLAPVQARYVASVTPILSAVGMAALLMMLIACANVAVLLLVRAVRRQHELVIRLALGASRARLAGLLVTESALLVLVSTGLALAISRLVLQTGLGTLERHLGHRLPGGIGALGLDSSVVIAVVIAALAVTAVLALVPLIVAAVPSLAPGLASSGRSGTPGRSARRVRAALATTEVAGALALLVGAALMIDTTRRVIDEDPGVRGDVITTSVGLRARSYPSAASRSAFFERLLQHLDAQGRGPGAMGAVWPLQTAARSAVTTDEAAPVTVRAAVTPVTAGYFDTLGIALRDGTTFDADDRPGGARVAVASESLAARLWPGQRAVGRTLRVPIPAEDERGEPLLTVYHVVGVAADVNQLSTDGPAIVRDTDRLELYLPMLQHAGRFAFVYIPARGMNETQADEPLRRAVAAIDQNAAVAPARSLGSAIEQLRQRPRGLAWLLTVLAASATLLALLGVYGVFSYAVQQREREVGVRLAIGAAPGQVVWMFVREGVRMLAVGLAIGAAGALALGSMLESQLFGVSPFDPRLTAAAVALLGLCGLLACWWPARRAARLGPATVLRGE